MIVYKSFKTFCKRKKGIVFFFPKKLKMRSRYLENKKMKPLNEKSTESWGSLLFDNLFKQKTSGAKAEQLLPVSEKNIPAPVAYYQCVICMDNVTSGTRFYRSTGFCNHKACIGCTRSYFMNALEDDRYINSYASIQCPAQNCEKTFTTSKCLTSILSQREVDEWWRAALIKTLIENKVYIYIYITDL